MRLSALIASAVLATGTLAAQVPVFQARSEVVTVEGLGAPGQPLRLYVATREAEPGLEILIVVFWRSAEELASADLAGTSMLLRARGAGLADLTATHFEIDGELERPADRRPVALRIATGTFSKPGADIDDTEIFASVRIQDVRCASACAVSHSEPPRPTWASVTAPAKTDARRTSSTRGVRIIASAYRDTPKQYSTPSKVAMYARPLATVNPLK